jgi:hypothetical protein
MRCGVCRNRCQIEPIIVRRTTSTWIRLLPALLLLTGVMPLDATGPGYLVSLGPTALRWKTAEPIRYAARNALPPLKMTDEDPASPQPPPGGNSTMLPALSEGPAVSNPAEPTPTAPAPAPAPASSVYPDLLNTLFYAPLGTNGFGGAVMPMPFLLPTQSARSTSSATYSTSSP